MVYTCIAEGYPESEQSSTFVPPNIFRRNPPSFVPNHVSANVSTDTRMNTVAERRLSLVCCVVSELCMLDAVATPIIRRTTATMYPTYAGIDTVIFILYTVRTNIFVSCALNKMSCCSICIEEMKCESFTAAGEDDIIDSADPSAMRLKCGHAYHVSCIMAGFRASGVHCPTCGPPKRTMNDLVQEVMILVNEDEDEEDHQADQDYVLAELVREHVRKRNRNVKEARKHYKKSVKNYNVYARSLVSERNTLVRSALDKFRKEKKKEFTKQVQAVKRALNMVKEAERTAIEETGDLTPEQLEQFMADEEQYEYHVNDVLASKDMTQPDPLDRSFWLR